VKGGRLAAAAGRATKITLAVTDVPAGHESALASGPSLPDPTTSADAERVLSEFKILEHLPASVRACVQESARRETPKKNDPAFTNAHFVMLMGTDDLFHPAHCVSEAKGFFTCCDNTTDDWSVERAAAYLLDQLSALQAANPSRPVAILADGEVSSPVTGDGTGGRNSAFVLACVENIVGRRVAVLSAGTDGIDGNSAAAGAVADGETLARAMAAGLHPADAFQRSDAFTFFAALDDAVVTGPTGNNLRDLRILLSEP
jgi:hydroxypyruvate reductase